MKTLFLACTSVLALTVSLANAESANEETRQQVVSYADLDLDEEADAAALIERIRTAARVVCRTPGVAWMPLESFLRAQRCGELATEQAIRRVGATSLTGLVAHTGVSPSTSGVRTDIAKTPDAASRTSLAAGTLARHVRQSRK